jgi:hypothetical protein
MMWQVLVAAALLPVCSFWLSTPAHAAAFTFGLALYSTNALLLTYLVDRLFQAVGDGASRPRPGQGRLVLLALVKLLLVAGGVALALMVFHYPVVPLVSGALAGLAATTIATLVSDKKTLFSVDDLRY